MYQFSVPCLESAFRLDIDQVVITGQTTIREGDRQVLVFEVRLVEPGWWCRSCGCQGRSRGSRSRLLTHAPNGSRPVRLLALHKRGCRWCLNPPVWRRLRWM